MFLCKETNVNLIPSLATKVDHGLKCELFNYKTLGKSMGDLQDLSQGKVFLDLTPKARPMRGKVSKLDLRSLSHFYLTQDALKRVKRQALTGKDTREPHIRQGLASETFTTGQNQTIQLQDGHERTLHLRS